MIDNLNYLKAFYYAALTGSISQAAEVLYASQPNISRAISCPKEELGKKRRIRNSRGVKLTEEGHVLYYHLQDMFESLKKAEVELNHINEFGLRELRIGVSTSLCRYILMPYLKRFISDNPHIKVTIDCHSTFNILKQLEADNIDMGFICETGLPSSYFYKPFQEVHDVFVATESYLKNLILREKTSRNDSMGGSTPLFMAGNITGIFNIEENRGINYYKNIYEREERFHNRVKKHDKEGSTDKTSNDDVNNNEIFDDMNNNELFNDIDTKEILEFANLMLLEKNNITRKHLDSYFYDNDINPGHILEINNMDLLIDFASIGMGVSGVVREFVLDELEKKQIIEIPLDNPIPTRTVGFVFKKYLPADSPSILFMESCI